MYSDIKFLIQELSTLKISTTDNSLIQYNTNVQDNENICCEIICNFLNRLNNLNNLEQVDNEMARIPNLHLYMSNFSINFMDSIFTEKIFYTIIETMKKYGVTFIINDEFKNKILMSQKCKQENLIKDNNNQNTFNENLLNKQKKEKNLKLINNNLLIETSINNMRKNLAKSKHKIKIYNSNPYKRFCLAKISKKNKYKNKYFKNKYFDNKISRMLNKLNIND